jgi:hypothetical protein
MSQPGEHCCLDLPFSFLGVNLFSPTPSAMLFFSSCLTGDSDDFRLSMEYFCAEAPEVPLKITSPT